MRRPVVAPAPPPRLGWFGRVLASLRNSFIAGVVVIAPIGLTVWLVWTVTGWVDSAVMPFVPRYYHPEVMLNRWLGNPPGSEGYVDVDIRGVGVVLFLIVAILVGWVTRGLIGRSLIRAGEDALSRVPIVRPVYGGLKQIAETVFNQGDARFERICLVEFPRKGLWSIAFISAPPKGEVLARLQAANPGEEMVAIFRPMTPNLTAGFIMFTRRSEIIELDLSLEEAAKLVISAGLVYPGDRNGGPPDVA